MNKERIAIIGSGGFGREVYHIIDKNKYDIIGYIDKSNNKSVDLPSKIIGDDRLIKNLITENKCKNVCVCIADIKIRKKIFELVYKHNLKTPSIIDESVIIKGNVTIGFGSIIYPGSIIMEGAKIGKGVLINSNVNIGHDSIIGDNCNINPGVNIAGMVNIEKESFLGIGSSIKENINIGMKVIVGGGSMVIKNIPENTMNYGVPSKTIKTLS